MVSANTRLHVYDVTTSWRHVDIMTSIAVHCNLLCANCWFLKTGLGPCRSHRCPADTNQYSASIRTVINKHGSVISRSRTDERFRSVRTFLYYIKTLGTNLDFSPLFILHETLYIDSLWMQTLLEIKVHSLTHVPIVPIYISVQQVEFKLAQ